MLENKIDEVIYNKFEKEAEKNKNRNKIKKSSKKEKRISVSKRKVKKNSSKNVNKRVPVHNSSKSQNILSNITSNAKGNQNKASSQFKTQSSNNNILEGSKTKPDTDYEMNWLSYKEALIFDKRANCEYYGSLLKSKQLFIFTFCTFNDYNSGVIKKFMLFLSFALHYTVNTLFFDDKNMHQIYEDKGKYNFEYQIPFILYSAIISTLVLRLMLKFLVLTDKDILQIKLQPTKNNAVNMKEKKLKGMKIKFAIFFILNFILLGLFWYYLTSFNAIYENTQVYLIENTFISFGFSLFYPFIINIFPDIIRMCSLHSANKNQEYSYKVSQIIQLI